MTNSANIIKVREECDNNGNTIHFKDYDGYEYWKEYDSNGNCIYYKNSNSIEIRYNYDDKGKLISRIREK